MYCVPACKKCREAGSCPKGTLPASPVVLTGTDPYRALVPIELPPMRSCTHLSCGCVTTREQQLLYAVWRPRDSLVFRCTKHGDWFPAVSPRRVVLPDDPRELF